ncbi:short-chain dehydrogenase [Pontibacillus halophilus JSM 076056 = DSM 19796]|uniref:Short-chain dehydrogenase n=1 Tax=Pontibacillus halophilus JSM 076056 = DSM 19796 TaxID=1385510 RepID=A0A0A5GJK2_9BACI|nr:SDR family oxidoreductase [Pontibacillus halophilus]KGX91335.1 short-chain dehydrogenase [Pontibacillus halophilus JSM 076056 = DSM 19796]
MGRVVIITGSASGIGQEAARKFASKGDSVVLGDYNAELGQETALKLQEEGYTTHFVKTDVSNYEDVERLVDEAVTKFGTVDVMVNNAGIGMPTSILETNLENYHKVIDVNQHGVAYGIMLAAQKMKGLNVKGVIINISSVYGYLASPKTFAYHATKGAVNMMTKSAALELAPHGIRVVAVAPGIVDTPILDGYRNAGLIDGMKKKVLGEELTTPEQLADSIYLVSLEEANAMNGNTVMADHGYASFK